MATVISSTTIKRVERTFFENVEVTEYNLTLDKEEAEVLLAVTALVAGYKHSTYRGETDAIARALEGAGVRYGFTAKKYFDGMLTGRRKD